MSWTAPGIQVGPEGLDEAAVQSKITDYGDQSDEMKAQVHAAAAAAAGIINSGAVGAPDAGYVVSLSGHANPEHAPRDGWAQDGVTVQVTQAVAAGE